MADLYYFFYLSFLSVFLLLLAVYESIVDVNLYFLLIFIFLKHLSVFLSAL